MTQPIDDHVTYRSFETTTLSVVDCCDCGDPALVFAGATRCDECETQHQDDLIIARRLLQKNRRKLLAAALRADVSPCKDPSSERDVLCDECGEVATTFTGPADPIDGKACMCPHCGTVGKVVVGDDEGSAWVRFRAYTEEELDQ